MPGNSRGALSHDGGSRLLLAGGCLFQPHPSIACEISKGKRRQGGLWSVPFFSFAIMICLLHTTTAASKEQELINLPSPGCCKWCSHLSPSHNPPLQPSSRMSRSRLSSSAASRRLKWFRCSTCDSTLWVSYLPSSNVVIERGHLQVRTIPPS